MEENKLKNLRKEIELIDENILSLVNQRASLAKEIGRIKNQYDLHIYKPEREVQLVAKLKSINQGPLGANDIDYIFKEIISSCRALEKRPLVAFLGPYGTYSQQALNKQFGKSTEKLACSSIAEIFREVELGNADFGIVPVENSYEGSVNLTLDLFLQTSVPIIGELELQIEHHLINKTGKKDDVKKIYGHSQAIAQCYSWLNSHFSEIEKCELSSSGEAARYASENKKFAAVAGDLAIQKYSLKKIYSQIQDDPNNRTRFAVIGFIETSPSGFDQTSLILSVLNKPGAMHKLLSPLAKHSVSMNRVESRPARTGTWEYFFHIDIAGHQKEEKVNKALVELKDCAAFFKILGSYPKAK
tara:strand:+ start:302 stop:1375 length:1074 start_codon:yes stop_codon:yes gene_type:complete